MIHVTLIKIEFNGVISWKLYDDAGAIEAFGLLQEHMLSNSYSYETRRRYSYAVANFIDYLYEIKIIGPDAAVTNKTLGTAIETYPLFLQGAQQNFEPQLSEYALKLKKKALSKNSFPPVISALNKFLHICQHLADEACSLASVDSDFDNIKLVIQNINGNKAITPHQRRHLSQNTVLGGVIRATNKKLYRPSKVYTTKPNQHGHEALDFPFTRVGDLLNAAISYRDKSFYALLASSGLRSSEARSIRMSDIDSKNLTLKVHDPDSVRSGLNSQTKGHRYKGRHTSHVFLIEPFKTLFFKYFVEYIRKERVNSVPHEYVFQCLHGRNRGKPFKDAADSTINDAFKTTCKRAKIFIDDSGEDHTHTLHSLRHMYGVLLINYYSLENGETFSLTEVQQMMGHKLISSTKKYARHDNDLITAKMEAANQLIMENITEPKELGFIFAKKLRDKASKIEHSVRLTLKGKSHD